jgi:hypothetical protein
MQRPKEKAVRGSRYPSAQGTFASEKKRKYLKRSFRLLTHAQICKALTSFREISQHATARHLVIECQMRAPPHPEGFEIKQDFSQEI